MQQSPEPAPGDCVGACRAYHVSVMSMVCQDKCGVCPRLYAHSKWPAVGRKAARQFIRSRQAGSCIGISCVPRLICALLPTSTLYNIQKLHMQETLEDQCQPGSTNLPIGTQHR